MKPTFHSLIPGLTLAVLALVLLASANTTAASAATNTAAVPELRTEAGPNWLKRHDFFVDIANHETACQLLFLGDSITDFWRERALGIWGKNYGPYAAENFGISGDRTQHLLWRLQNGEIGNLRPKAIVLHDWHEQHRLRTRQTNQTQHPG